MTRRKRLAKLARQAAAGRPAPAPVSSTVDLLIPSAGAATVSSGWRLPWRQLIASGRRPFAFLPLLLVSFLVFALIKMTGIYLITLVWWGTDVRDPNVEKWLNAGLWQMGSWLMGPTVLMPWLAGSVVFANGLKVPWRLVKEPLAEKHRLRKLAVIGLVGLVVAGAMGASTAPALAKWGAPIVIGVGAGLWWFVQVTLLSASAGVWQENKGAWRALKEALIGWRYGWKAYLSSSVSTLLMAVLVIGVTVTVLVGPMLAIGLPPTRLGWMGFLALPALIVLWAWWSHLQARLALAFWQWGEPPTPVVPVEPTVSPTFAA